MDYESKTPQFVIKMYAVGHKIFNTEISSVQLIFFFSLQHVKRPAEEVESFLLPIRPDPVYVCHHWYTHGIHFQKHHPLDAAGCI